MKIENAVNEWNLSLLGEVRDISREWYISHVRKLVDYLPPGTEVEAITARDLRHWRAFLINSKKYKSGTINHILANGKRFFSFCVRDNIIDADPAAGLGLIQDKQKSKPPAAIEVDDFLRLVNYCVSLGKKGVRDLAIVLCLFGTGCRVNGLCGLKLDDLYLNEGKALVVEKGRDGGKERWIYLEIPVRIALEDYIYNIRPHGRGPHVFHGERGSGLTRQGVWYILDRTAERAGVDGVHNPHSFRHAYAIQMLLRGMTLSVVSRLLGHADIAITHRYYARFAQDDLQAQQQKYSLINDLAVSQNS